MLHEEERARRTVELPEAGRRRRAFVLVELRIKIAVGERARSAGFIVFVCRTRSETKIRLPSESYAGCTLLQFSGWFATFVIVAVSPSPSPATS
jgi:hypothetical protein